MKIEAASRLRAATQTLLFSYPKELNYSGYVYLVPVKAHPNSDTGLKKTVGTGVYKLEDFVRVAGIPTSSHLVDQVSAAFTGLTEISVGREVKVGANGQAAFTTHMGNKVTLSKAFTDFLVKHKYLVTSDEFNSQ